jgi:tripartite-type tricarboxylate transporter receptor subunit TctC
MRLLISSYEILDLTLDIQQRFPRVWPDLPECDEAALLELLTFTRELYVFWRLQMPQPDFDRYSQEVKVLLNLFQIPRGSR